MRATSANGGSSDTSVTTSNAAMLAGTTPRARTRLHPTITTTASSASSAGVKVGAAAHERTVAKANTTMLSPCGVGVPSTFGNCCRKMITAMPLVNPVTTGHGMKRT